METFREFTGDPGVITGCIAENKCSCALLWLSLQINFEDLQKTLDISDRCESWCAAYSVSTCIVYSRCWRFCWVDFWLWCISRFVLAACWENQLSTILGQPSRLHFRWFGHVRNECLPFKHEKQSWFSAAILARCVGVFSLKIWHRQIVCCDLQSTQGGRSFFELWDCLLTLDDFELDANTFEDTLVFTAPLLLVSSALLRKEVVFMRSWPSALSFNQSLKSNIVGRIKSVFTVCKDHDSFKLGGNFWTAWFTSYELLRSAS